MKMSRFFEDSDDSEEDGMGGILISKATKNITDAKNLTFPLVKTRVSMLDKMFASSDEDEKEEKEDNLNDDTNENIYCNNDKSKTKEVSVLPKTIKDENYNDEYRPSADTQV